jgi:hypothetical protein
LAVSVVVYSDPMIAIAQPGYGYVAGESPGIVTIDNVPGRAAVDLLRRSDHVWLRRQYSQSNGTYRFSTIPLGVEYDIIGRDLTNTWGDVIVSRVQPYAPPQISNASLAFAAGNPATTQMAALYGGAELTWSIDVLPPGLSLSPGGLWSGTPTAGSTPVVVTVVDEFGESGSRAYTVVVT